MNIYIIGLPLSGKNHIAKNLKQLLNYNLININNEIETQFNKKLYDVYNTIGHNTYLGYEHFKITTFIKENKNTIFILPNTTLYNETIQSLLNKTGTLIYVRIEFKEFLSKYLNDNSYLLLNDNEDIYNIYKNYDNLFIKLTKNIIYYIEDNEKNINNLKHILDINE
jgi:shikimate kinase